MKRTFFTILVLMLIFGGCHKRTAPVFAPIGEGIEIDETLQARACSLENEAVFRSYYLESLSSTKRMPVAINPVSDTLR